MSNCNHLGFEFYDDNREVFYCARCSEVIDEPIHWTEEEIAEAKGL